MRESKRKRKVIDYFKKNLKKGYTEESLRWALINQGYSRVLVEDAIRTANKELAEKAPKLKEKPIIKYEVIDENNKPIKFRKSWWEKFFGL